MLLLNCQLIVIINLLFQRELKYINSYLIEENEVNNIILFCSEIGLFNEEILKKHSTLTSRSIQERYVRVCKEAKRTEINLPKELDLINYYGNNLALLPESIELLPESIELIIKL